VEAEAAANGNQVKISNARQQQIYEEEKRKVWDLQQNALSNPVPPELLPHEEIVAPAKTSAALGPRFRGDSARRGMSRGGSIAASTPGYMESPRDGTQSPGFSGDDESTFTGHDRNAGKILRIQRIVCCSDHRFG